MARKIKTIRQSEFYWKRQNYIRPLTQSDVDFVRSFRMSKRAEYFLLKSWGMISSQGLLPGIGVQIAAFNRTPDYFDIADDLVEEWTRSGIARMLHVERQDVIEIIGIVDKQNAARKTWDAARRSISKKIFDESGKVCASCEARKGLTIDHVIPIGLGGHPVEPGNLQVLCRRCNASKGSRHAARY